MKREQWERIEQILDQALSLESLAEQEQFILDASENNPNIWNEVRKLLHAIHDARRSGFMEE